MDSCNDIKANFPFSLCYIEQDRIVFQPILPDPQNRCVSTSESTFLADTECDRIFAVVIIQFIQLFLNQCLLQNIVVLAAVDYSREI